MKNTAVLLLTVAVAVLTFMVVRGSRTSQQAHVALAAAIDERDSLRNRVAELESNQRTLAAQITNARAPAVAPVASAPSAGTPAFAPAGRVRRSPPEIFDSPEMRRLMALQQKAHLDLRYAALFRALGLPPEKLNQLKQLLVDKQNAGMDVLAAARQHPESGVDVSAMMHRENQLIDAAIRDVLGDTAFEEYQDFERTQPERSMVDQLASRLSYSDAPLSDEQSEALVDLLSAQRSTQDPANAPSNLPVARVAVGPPGGMVDVVGATSFVGQPVLDETSLEAASAILTETQLAALREIQAAQEAQRQIGELLRRSLPGANAQTVMIAPGAAVSTAPVEPPTTGQR